MTTTSALPLGLRRGSIPEKGPLDRLLAHFEATAGTSSQLLSKNFGSFEIDGRTYTLPRYVLLGPKGGGDTIRLGLFAVINGDEPEGAYALLRLLSRLEIYPEVAKNYALFIYPVCNPTGFEDNTPHARGGRDLQRLFWTDSKAPEVQFLEAEIWKHAFDGIITLRSDKTTDGIYGSVNGEVLSANLLEPALTAASQYVPRNRSLVIDGANAHNGIISRSRAGGLSVPGLARPPFELSLITPRQAPLDHQIDSFIVALETILVHYRTLIATAQNI